MFKHLLTVSALLSLLILSAQSQLTPPEVEQVMQIVQIETRKAIDGIDYEAEFERVRKDILDFDKLWDSTISIRFVFVKIKTFIICICITVLKVLFSQLT
jgi:hypothetical protein